MSPVPFSHKEDKLFRYDSYSNVISTTTGITTTSLVRATTLYTFTYNVRYTDDSLLTEQRAPNGVVTRSQRAHPDPLRRAGSRLRDRRSAQFRGNCAQYREHCVSLQWYAVRRTLSDTGTPGAPLSYDPWGTPQYGATPPTFGFTGELHDSASGMVNLRARWYHTGRGTFTSRDPFAGFAKQPYSLHPYQYGYSNPVLYNDPTGTVTGGGGIEEQFCRARGGYWDADRKR
jgi:RHS repeat-associated protein